MFSFILALYVTKGVSNSSDIVSVLDMTCFQPWFYL